MSVNVTAITLGGWNYGGDTATLYVWANQTYLASDNTLVQYGTFGDVRTFAVKGECAVVGTDLIVPLVTLQPTTDSDLPLATLSAALCDSYGALVSDFGGFNGTQFRVPHDLGATISWQEIREYNATVAAPDVTQTRDSYSKTATDALIASAIAAASLSSAYVNVKPAAQYGTLVAAYAANPTDEVTIWITEPLQTGTNSTQPENVQLMFSGDGRLVTSAPRTVTLTRPPVAAPDQWCFDVADGNLTIKTVGDVYPDQFGNVTAGVTYPIQAAIDAVCDSGGKRGRTILRSTQAYAKGDDWPVRIDAMATELVGEGAGFLGGGQASITGTCPGAIVYVGKPATNPTFDTAITGSGRALNMSGAECLNFRQCGLNLNGRSTFTFEGWVNWTAYGQAPDEYGGFFQSYGVRSLNFFNAADTKEALSIRVDGVGKVRAAITVNGVLYVATSAANAIPLNTDVHVAGVYNGTTYKVYVQGVELLSIAAAGSITQAVAEDIMLGCVPLWWPHLVASFNAQTGRYGNIRISSNARYSGTFTPPTGNFTPDANTLVDLNFATADVYRDMMRFRTTAADAYGYLCYFWGGDGNYTTDTVLRDFAAQNPSGPAVITQNAPLQLIDNVALSGTIALWAHNIKYLCRWRNLRIPSYGSTANLVGIMSSGNGAAGTIIEGHVIEGYGYCIAGFIPFATLGAGFMNAQSETIALLYYASYAPTIVDAFWDIESNPAAGVTREGFAIFTSCNNVTFVGGKFNDAVGGQYPHLTFQNGANGDTLVSLTGTIHNVPVTPANGLIKVIKDPAYSAKVIINIDNSTKPTAVAWMNPIPSFYGVLNLLGVPNPVRSLTDLITRVTDNDNTRTLLTTLAGRNYQIIPAGLESGFIMRVVQGAAGAARVSGDAGVTLRAPNGTQTTGQYAEAEVVSLGANTYLVRGEVTAGTPSPTDIPGLAVWLDAAAITGLANNDPVGTWLDVSGNARHATQTDAAKKPVYKTAIQNGLPIVRFDATDDGLSVLQTYSLAGPCTVFIIYSARGASPYPGNPHSAVHFANKYGIGPFGANYFVETGYNAATNITGSALALNVFKAHAWRLGASSAGSYTQVYRINDALQGTEVIADNVSYNPLAMVLGKTPAGYPAGEALDGDIAEVLVYEGVLTDANLTMLYNYAVSKWAI